MGAESDVGPGEEGRLSSDGGSPGAHGHVGDRADAGANTWARASGDASPNGDPPGARVHVGGRISAEANTWSGAVAPSDSDTKTRARACCSYIED
jgi:hypothetical protein